MSTRLEVAQSARCILGTPGNAAGNEGLARGIVPRLPDHRTGEHPNEQDSRPQPHRAGISRRAWTRASILLLAVGACTDVGLPGTPTVPTADLVVLALDAAAPAPASATFFVPNGRSTVRTLRHPDPFNTLYLELRFAAGGLSSLNGQPLAADDSVEVTVQVLSGGYGFTLSPSGLTFSESPPTALFSFGRYADPTGGLAVFPDREAYLAALDIWREVGVDRWATARGSGPAGIDEVRATVEGPGRFRLAAVAP